MTCQSVARTAGAEPSRINPAAYIGVPFLEHGRYADDGLDCWGLVRLVLREQLGVELPDLGYSYPHSHAVGAITLTVGEQLPSWQEVERGQEQPGDVVLLRILGAPIHVGVVTEPGWMLHVMQGIDTCLERYDGPIWSRRIEGIFTPAGWGRTLAERGSDCGSSYR